MNKRDLFIKAMNATEYKRRAWLISAFALINESQDEWKKNPIPYRIVQTPAGHFFVDPENDRQLTLIEDAKPGEPVYSVYEKLLIGLNDKIPNFVVSKVKTTQPATGTTYGILLANYIVFCYAFGSKIPYINGKISPKIAEAIILPRLRDNPENPDDRKEEEIYMDEYLNFLEAMFHLTGLMQICVPAATPKTIMGAPGITELRNKLLEENKDQLNDPAVIAKISKQLVDYDKAYMKGDPGEGFLIEEKQYNVVRSKLFGMHGAEGGMGEKTDTPLITNSLDEGWNMDNFPLMNNSLRAGSYDRGAETQKGGESVKWLFRASSNCNVTEDDCGTTLGKVMTITDDNYKQLVGFSIITKDNPLLINTEEEAKVYIGKIVTVRSPMYCKLDETDYCKTCVGVNLANNPTGISLAISNFGSVLMYISMKSMHGKALTLQHLDIKSTIF